MVKHIGDCDANIFLRTHRSKDPTIKYLTGVDTDLGLLITFKNPRKKPVLFISPLEQRPQRSDLSVNTIEFSKLEKVFKNAPVKTIGINYNEMKLASYDLLKSHLEGYTFKNIGKDVAVAREIKTTAEIKKLSHAIKITEKILGELIGFLSEWTYEQEAIHYIKQRAIDYNVKLAFEPIIATGAHASVPHYMPRKNSKILNGFCIIDMGICYEGYHADISRTVFIGTPTKQDKLAYEKVRKEQQRLEKDLYAGAKEIKSKLKIGHAFGHGIGLDVHEAPHLGYETLKTNMTIALEPAEYGKKQGIRIEDDYVVKKTGLQRLSTSTRELIVIKRKKKS